MAQKFAHVHLYKQECERCTICLTRRHLIAFIIADNVPKLHIVFSSTLSMSIEEHVYSTNQHDLVNPNRIENQCQNWQSSDIFLSFDHAKCDYGSSRIHSLMYIATHPIKLVNYIYIYIYHMVREMYFKQGCAAVVFNDHIIFRTILRSCKEQQLAQNCNYCQSALHLIWFVAIMRSILDPPWYLQIANNCCLCSEIRTLIYSTFNTDLVYLLWRRRTNIY